MNFLTLLGVAVALAMDAFAVALATGINLKAVGFRQTFRLSWHFGLFQALMPIIGWFLGSFVVVYVRSYAHWIAFGMLALVGANMIKGALQHEEEALKKDATKGLTLIMLSVATSIDALAVGVGLSMVHAEIFFPALLIGIVACLFTIAGLHLGKKAAQIKKIRPIAEMAGGLILWLIGLNILRESGVFSLF